MTLYETTFRLQHDCPINDFSKLHPELVMSTWCNSETDVLEIAADDETTFGELQKDLKTFENAMHTKFIRKSSSSRNVQMLIRHCECNMISAPVSPVFEKNSCLELQPATYKG